MIKSGQAIAGGFPVDSAPDGAITATLIVNGVDNAAVLTVTNSSLNYKWAGTAPTLAAGDIVQVRAAGAWSATAASAIVWSDVADTALASDAYSRLGAPAGASVSADVAAVKSETATIVADTNELQLNQGNWVTATGFSTHSAADVWAAGTRTLSSYGTLVADINASIWNALTSGLTTAGSIGKLIVDKITGLDFTGSGGTLKSESTNMRGTDNANTTTPPTVSAIQSGLATSSELTAIKGAGWTTETLKAIKDAIPAAAPNETAIQNAAAAAMTAQGYTTTRAPKLDNLDAAVSSIGGAVGSGGISWTHTVTDSTTSAPIADCSVWVSTDSAGSNVIAGTLLTNASGGVTFMLDAGTYYFWHQKTGVNFDNPDIEAVA